MEFNNFIVSQTKVCRIPLAVFQEIIRSGEVTQRFNARDKIILEFDGREEQFEIIGIDVEELVDKNLKHSVTLQAVRLIGEERPFDEDGNNDWSRSSLRKYMQSEEFLSRFKENMKNYTALVVKKNGKYEDTQDRFFILSKDEVRGGYPAIKTEKDRVKEDLDGKTDWYRSRSAIRSNAHDAWCVYASGSVYNSGASHASRFAPACVIA